MTTDIRLKLRQTAQSLKLKLTPAPMLQVRVLPAFGLQGPQGTQGPPGAPGGGAPTDAQYLVSAADATLTAERVATDTPSITWDFATAAQAKAKRAALTGDVTASADSNATTIAANAVTTTKIVDDAVTFAKMQNIATDSLIGRDTAATGDPENITLNATLEMDGAGNLRRAALTGDVTATAGANATTIANNAVSFAKFQDITSDRLIGRDTAATGDPEEISISGGLEFTGGPGIRDFHTVNAQTGTTYTYVDGDRAKLVTHNNAAAIAGTLPQAGASSQFVSGWFMDVENRGAGTLTITPTTSTIDGAASLALTQNQGVRIFSDGTNYFTQRGIGGGSGFTAASQAEMEAATENAKGVTPLVAHFAPSAAKYWQYTTVSGGTPTLQASYNVTSITDTAIGRLTVTIATDFSSVNWASTVTATAPTSSNDVTRVSSGTVAAGSVEISFGGGVGDPAAWHSAGYGDQ